jgi:chemotaxis protein MotB
MQQQNVENTTDVVKNAGLRKGGAFRAVALAVLIAGLGALVSALFLKSARDSAVARATAAEASAQTAMDKLRSLTTERDELKAQVERYQRENEELLALKTKLASDVAAKDEELAKLNAARDELANSMKDEIKAGDVSLSEDGGRLRVDLVDKVLFDSGEAVISKRGEEVLKRVGKVLAGAQDKIIQVSGHTDDSPPTAKIQDKFPTNWELSTTRATNVVRFLQDQAGIAGKRLTATGYGQFKPVATNANPTGRARNRRIEILLVPEIQAVRSSSIAKAR